MGTRRIIVSVALCAALVACASPQQRCLNDATRELRTIDQLIRETEGNLERGFAIETEIRSSPSVSFCGGWYNTVGVSFCTNDRIVERERAVAIDPAAEQRKLDDLRARRGAIEEETGARAAACQAT